MLPSLTLPGTGTEMSITCTGFILRTRITDTAGAGGRMSGRAPLEQIEDLPLSDGSKFDKALSRPNTDKRFDD